MDHKIKLDELDKETLEKLEAYMQERGNLEEADREKFTEAHSEWRVAWNKLMETLLVLEKLEI